MKRWIEMGVLVVSHAWVALVAFTALNALFTKLEIDRSFADPLYRTAIRLLELPAETSEEWPPVAEDLAHLKGSLGAAAADTFGLMFALEKEGMQGALASCQALGWPRCDSAALAEMRKLVSP
jgi:hypothetical protein